MLFLHYYQVHPKRVASNPTLAKAAENFVKYALPTEVQKLLGMHVNGWVGGRGVDEWVGR